MNTEENEIKRCRKKVIVVKNDFDYDRLAKAIIKVKNIAEKEIEQQRQDVAAKEHKEILQKRKDYLKEKDFFISNVNSGGL